MIYIMMETVLTLIQVTTPDLLTCTRVERLNETWMCKRNTFEKPSGYANVERVPVSLVDRM
jgi:hypothetical protein